MDGWFVAVRRYRRRDAAAALKRRAADRIVIVDEPNADVEPGPPLLKRIKMQRQKLRSAQCITRV